MEAFEEATKSGAKSLIEFSDASRSSKGNFCPSGTTFSTFGFASFLLITLQTVINIVTGKNLYLDNNFTLLYKVFLTFLVSNNNNNNNNNK